MGMDRSLQNSLAKSLVTVYRTDSNSGMEVYVDGDYIITAAHCLPKVPNRDLQGEDVVGGCLNGEG